MAKGKSDQVTFIEPMECMPVTKVSEGNNWVYEIKLDGYRLEVVKSQGKMNLYTRQANILNNRFPYIASALDYLPEDTVIDGELVALGEDGKPSFNLLQNFRSSESHIMLYVFDILIHAGQDVMRLPLSERRKILASVIEPGEHVRISEASNLTRKHMLEFIRSHGLEGVIAKRADSLYQPGIQSGLWSKYRTNLAQEFVVDGYVPSNLGVNSLVIGVYRDGDLHYSARVPAGFVPTTRRKVFEQIKHLETKKCPFVNLPGKEPGR
jgi:ATP-dependent DNA ligase